MFLYAAAFAYETDQITHRAVPLEDIALAANSEVDRMLSEAALATNRITGCKRTLKVTRRVLARQIYAVASHNSYVPNRGELAGFGHGAYAAWLESADVPRRILGETESIYGDLDASEAFVLGTAGVCATVRIAGVLMGTDKPDHFFGQGYEYLRASGHGRDDARAVVRGTRTERGAYGLLTSYTFSWADLYANWQGYQFYRSLLDKASVLRRDAEGCVQRVAGWSWADWLDDGADELVNPPYYLPPVGDSVRARLQRNRDAICAGYEDWGPAAELRRQQITARELPHSAAFAPERRDEWDLPGLCAGEAPAANRAER